MIIGKISSYYTIYLKHQLNHIHIFFNSQIFVSDSLGGITNTFPPISSPCKKEVLTSMASSFQIFCAISASKALNASGASLGQFVESFYIIYFYLATIRGLFIRLSMFQKEQIYLNDINFSSVYGTSV